MARRKKFSFGFNKNLTAQDVFAGVMRKTRGNRGPQPKKKPTRKLGRAYNSQPNRTRRQMLNQKLPARKPNNNPSTRGTQLKTHK
jgi:hypothetical protein